MSSMRTGLYQGTHLKQEMKINPRLYQAMDLLYMPLLDLQQHIKQEMLNNPFLDLEEPQVSEDEMAPVEKEKEKEEKEKAEEIDWEEILLDGFEAGGRRAEYEEKEYYEPVSVESRDLYDHLRDQLMLLRFIAAAGAARRGDHRQHRRERLSHVHHRRGRSRPERMGRGCWCGLGAG
jgi:RNA polymerase sigma-54 factor